MRLHGVPPTFPAVKAIHLSVQIALVVCCMCSYNSSSFLPCQALQAFTAVHSFSSIQHFKHSRQFISSIQHFKRSQQFIPFLPYSTSSIHSSSFLPFSTSSIHSSSFLQHKDCICASMYAYKSCTIIPHSYLI